MQGLVNESSLEDIGAAIREKLGEDATFFPGEMAAAISRLLFAKNVQIIN